MKRNTHSRRFQLTVLGLTLTLAGCNAPPQLNESFASPDPAGKLEPLAVRYSPPITITKGGTYSGNWESKDWRQPAVTIATSDPVVITNSTIRGPGRLIYGNAQNRVTIRNSRGYGTNPNESGIAQGEFAAFESVRELTIANNFIQQTRGIMVLKYAGAPDALTTITITRNQFRNITGLTSDGQGGYTTTDTRAHTILFDKVQRVPNVDISWNEVINEPGRSAVEENFNLYVSSGTPGSPIRIHNNYIQGAYNASPATNSSYSGGGILVGDGVPTEPFDMGFTEVHDNHVVSTSNQGLAIAGGVHNTFYGNRVLASGLLPDGRRIRKATTSVRAQNVGVYTYDWNNLAGYTPSAWSHNRVTGNHIGWTVVKDDGSTWNNPTWFGTCRADRQDDCSGNTDAGTVTLEMERAEHKRWRNKVTVAGLKIGP